MKQITFLIHRIAKQPLELMEVSERNFRYLVDLALKNKLPVVKIKELNNKSLENKKCLSFTFDDGWESDYRVAFPYLAEKSLEGTFFITTDWVGKEGFLNWPQIQEMAKNGMEIGSHTKSHKLLTCLSKKQIYEELYISKCNLEDKLGEKIISLSIPEGEYNKNILDIARKVGYQIIAISRPGINHLSNNLAFRISLNSRSSEDEIKKILTFSNLTFFQLQTSYFFRVLLRKILGVEGYLKLRDSVLKNK